MTTDANNATVAAAAAAPPRELVIRARRGLVGVDWGELFRYRELLGFLIWRDFKVRYKQTVLGLGWAVLQPLFFMAVFSLIAMQLKISTPAGIPIPVYYFAGLLPWTFWSVGVQFSSQSLIGQQHLLTKVYLPRLYIPTSVILTGLVDMAVAFGVFVLMLIGFGVNPGLDILMLPVMLVLLILCTLGFGFLLSSLTVVYRDIRFIVPFFIQGMMFVSGLILSVGEMVGRDPTTGAWINNPHPVFETIFELNPLVGIIDGFRSSVSGAPWDWPLIGVSTAMTLVIFAIGLAVFRNIERRFADIA